MLYAKFVEPNAGYAHDQKKVEELELNHFYPVAAVSMGQSSTSITLQGQSGGFNSVNFEFYKKSDDKYVEHDIFSDPEYNPYIRNLYELSQYDNYSTRR